MWNNIKNIISGLDAIEIGGPTILFQNQMCIYDVLKLVDGVNLSDFNVWQNITSEYIYYQNKKGIQYIGDAVEIDNINISKKYDLLLSSHQIEHLANPIKALKSWKKILKNDSYILAILPNKEMFWDSVRETTDINHIINDYNKNISENDMYHLLENFKTSDFSTTIKKQRALENYKYRVLHHHCFDEKNTKEMFEFSGYKTIDCFIYDKDKLQIIYFGQNE